jgi:hypothetical protein
MTGAASDEHAPEWMYSIGAQAYGPASIAQLRAAASAGMLPPYTAVWNLRTRASQTAGVLIGTPAAAPPTAPSLGDDAGMRLLLPVGRSGWAIIAGYLGLMGWLIVPLAPFALMTAELGRRQIAADPRKHGMGREIIGFIGRAIGTALLLFFVFAATGP